MSTRAQEISIDSILARRADYEQNYSVDPSWSNATVTFLLAEVERLRADGLSWRRYLDATHCHCCGQFRGNCVCGAGVMTTSDGKSESWACSPATHGRDGYGFGRTEDTEPF